MDYTFASTIHKAQGSEFNRVWIDKADIQKSIFGGSYVNYARLMYVAISRARQTIFILG
jgi:ATP-dependent exoDNAse (exonuclease V) alpha subunit